MRTKAILFDKDGTLLAFDAFWISLAKTALGTLFAENGIPFPEEEILAMVGVKGGKTDINGVLVHGTYGDIAELVYPLMKEGGYQKAPEILHEEMNEIFCRCADAGEILSDCADLPSVLQQLQDAGITLAVVTSDTPEMTAKCLKEMGVEDFFETIYSDDGIHPNKPDPFAAEDFCRKWGFAKDEVVMVGDTMTDMRFAKNAGIRGVGIAKDEDHKKILSEATDTLIYDLSELFGVLQ
ncbi:MAG: HAD family hydrolase [Clostridia bacterium]|nr:HAD family hydrolase [Clostridia bacterium]